MKIRTQHVNVSEIFNSSFFLDREDPRKVFWDTYSTIRNTLNSDDQDVRIIHYYGIGGIGKSSLLKKIRQEMDERLNKSMYVMIDLESGSNMRDVLNKIRTSLVETHQFQFPLFDLAQFVYLIKSGLGSEHDDGALNNNRASSFISKNPEVQTLLDLAGLVIPGSGSVVAVIKSIDKLISKAKERYGSSGRQKDLEQLRFAEPQDIYASLPLYLAKDLNRNLESCSEPLVIFFDTYECLVNEMTAFGEPLHEDNWLREMKSGLTTNVVNCLWILAGREKLKWAEIDPHWYDSIHLYPLGDLSEVDSDDFLRKRGVKEESLRQDMYRLTNGTPIYLELCVNNYHALGQTLELRTIENIGNSTIDLIGVFMKYMDDEKKDLNMMLACLDFWTEDLLAVLCEKVLSNVSKTSLFKVNDYSYIRIISDEGIYTMHATIRQLFMERCPMSIKTKTSRVVSDYLFNLIFEKSLSMSEEEIYYLSYTRLAVDQLTTVQECILFYEGAFQDVQANAKGKIEWYVIAQMCELFLDKLYTIANEQPESLVKYDLDYAYALLNAERQHEAQQFIESRYRNIAGQLSKRDQRWKEVLVFILKNQLFEKKDLDVLSDGEDLLYYAKQQEQETLVLEMREALIKGYIHSEEGDKAFDLIADTIKSFVYCSDYDSSPIQSIIRSIELINKGGYPEQAIILYESLLKVIPANMLFEEIDIQNELSLIYYKLSDFAEAQEAVQRAINGVYYAASFNELDPDYLLVFLATLGVSGYPLLEMEKILNEHPTYDKTDCTGLSWTHGPGDDGAFIIDVLQNFHMFLSTLMKNH